MTIPSLPVFFDMIFTKEDGRLSSDGCLYNEQMFQSLNALLYLINNLSSTDITSGSVTINGFNPPAKTTAEITTLAALSNDTIPLGTIWYDSDVNKLKLKVAVGVVEQITSV